MVTYAEHANVAAKHLDHVNVMVDYGEAEDDLCTVHHVNDVVLEVVVD